MSRHAHGGDGRKLGLKKETLRKLSLDQLARVAGGSWEPATAECVETDDCDTNWMSTGSRFC